MQVWHGTVSQIEDHYGIKHMGVKVGVFNVTKDELISIQTIIIYQNIWE